MPKKSVKNRLKKTRRTRRSYKRAKNYKGGNKFPTVDNVIPYNKTIGTHGDPIDPANLLSTRNLIGGGKKKKRRGGSIFNYDLLTGDTFSDNAVQSLNTSSGTQNTLGKLTGQTQETGPTLSYKTIPNEALI